MLVLGMGQASSDDAACAMQMGRVAVGRSEFTKGNVSFAEVPDHRGKYCNAQLMRSVLTTGCSMAFPVGRSVRITAPPTPNATSMSGIRAARPEAGARISSSTAQCWLFSACRQKLPSLRKPGPSVFAATTTTTTTTTT